jgi:hypothetical protein
MRSLYSGLVLYAPLHTNNGVLAHAPLSVTDTTVSYVNGPVTGAADYAGGANYTTISATVNDLPIGATPHTVACWLNFDAVTAEAIPWLWGAASTRQYRCIGGYADKHMSAAFYSDDLTTAINTIVTGTWQYWITTFNGGVLNNTNVKMYVNNVNVALTGGSGNAINTPNAAIYLGRDMIRNSSPIDGKMAEFSVWNRLLTDREMTWLYNNGQGRTYPFDGRPYLIGRKHKTFQAGSSNDR